MHRPPFTPARLALGIALALGAATAPLHAADAAISTERRAIAIAAQPLDQALNDWARQVGAQIIVPQALVAGKQAPAVSGTLTPRQALDRLLADSGLAAGIEGGSVVVGKAATSGEQTLEEVKVTASGQAPADRFVTQGRPAGVGKSPVSVQDTPFSIGVVDVGQIRETGAKNLQEALLYSAGVYSGRYGFDTRGDWSSVRGLNAAAYTDGLRRIFGFYNNVRPEIYSLERIEVLKGPASVLYGQADLGGIINAVTKRPQQEAAREVEVQVGSHDRKQVAADLTGPLDTDGRWLYRLVTLARDSETQVDFVNDDAFLFMPSLTWRPGADTSVTLQYTHQQNKTKVSSQFLPAKGTVDPAPLGRIPSHRFAGEPDWDRYDTRKNEAAVFLDQKLSASWKLVANLRQTYSYSVTREIYTAVGPIPDDAGNIARTIHTADRETDVFTGDVRLEGSFSAGSTRHQAAIGIDHQDALWEEYHYASSRTADGEFNVYNPVYGNLDLSNLTWVDRPDNKIVQTGIYVMDHMEWGPWILSAALRRDRARNTVLNLGSTPDARVRNSATTGRLGLMVRFANGMSPYLSVSEAFVPNLGTDGTAANSYLKPTTGKQEEAGVKYLSGSGNTSAALAWFDIEETNRVVQGSTPGGVEQVGATTRGWELELRQRFGALELMGNYLDMEAINDATKKRLSSIAERTGSAWAQYRFAAGWRVGLGGRYIGTVTGAGGAPVLPSATLYDAMLGYATGAWDFRFDIKNVADKEYLSWCRAQDRDCGYGERRNAALTAKYRF